MMPAVGDRAVYVGGATTFQGKTGVVVGIVDDFIYIDMDLHFLNDRTHNGRRCAAFSARKVEFLEPYIINELELS